MLLRLADTGGEHAVVRRRASRDEVESVGGAVAPSVLDILAERRLVTVSDDMVEVAHEALLTQWPRLRQWLAEDLAGRELRAHLTPAAAGWARSGDEGELYRGTRLAVALEWLEHHAAELTRSEKDFLRASQDAAAWEELQSRRTVRRLRQTLAAAAVALVVAIAGCVVAVTQQRRADAAAAAADARRLAAQALVERDLGSALLFGVAATRLDDTPETRANLLATLNRAPALLRTDTLADGDQYQGLALSPDGLTLALSSARGRIQLYDAESLRLKRTLTYPGRYVARELDFTRDGRRLVTFADLVPVGDHGMVEWDLATGDPIVRAVRADGHLGRRRAGRRRLGRGARRDDVERRGVEPVPAGTGAGAARAGHGHVNVDRQRPALGGARSPHRHHDRRRHDLGLAHLHEDRRRRRAQPRRPDAARARGPRRGAVGRGQRGPPRGGPPALGRGHRPGLGPATGRRSSAPATTAR